MSLSKLTANSVVLHGDKTIVAIIPADDLGSSHPKELDPERKAALVQLAELILPFVKRGDDSRARWMRDPTNPKLTSYLITSGTQPADE